MTEEQEKEYHLLADKRNAGTLTNKEYKKWLELVEMSFEESFLYITGTWKEGFNIK